MKKFILNSLLVAAVVALTSGQTVFSQAKAKQKVKMPSQEEMMKRMQEYATPGTMHKKLAEMEGSWEVEVKMLKNCPSGQPELSKGTSEAKMVLDGHFLKEDFSGVMMNMPFNGISNLGYDNFKKKFIGSWIDSMNTAMSFMEGTMDRDGQVLTMWGKMDDTMTGEKNKTAKYVTKILDHDKRLFEIYDVTTYGDKNPVMVMTYTRKK